MRKASGRWWTCALPNRPNTLCHPSSHQATGAHAPTRALQVKTSGCIAFLRICGDNNCNRERLLQTANES